MPVSGTSTDYSARKKDIHIFQGVDVSKSAVITPSFGKISNYCAGIQKLVQRYAISLLTELGSQPAFTDFGSTLITNLKNRNLRYNRADVFHLFNFANVKVIKSFKEYQRVTDGIPPDEQLNTAILKDVLVTGDSVSLQVQIYPVQAGAVTFLLPIPTNS